MPPLTRPLSPRMLRHFLRRRAYLLDPMLAVGSYPAAWFLRKVREFGVEYLPWTRKALERAGAFPIRRHYHEPAFADADLPELGDRERPLGGVDLRWDHQLTLLESFDFSPELEQLPITDPGNLTFYYNNDSFGSGDAEIWYSVIRFLKPARIVEVGCGMSTLLAREALRRNAAESPPSACRHICIEPFEAPWLEGLGVEVLRTPVERTDGSAFEDLGPGDILFIDSSHVIRPGGDVLHLVLEVLPRLRPGVVVHVHDIFTPRDYKSTWIREKKRFWNEQYLLEAFLTLNPEFQVMLAVNLLAHRAPDLLARRAPIFGRQRAFREPGSFYMQRREPAVATR